MRSIVTNFIQFNIQSMHDAVYWGVAAVWVMLLVSAFMSLRSLSIPFWAKFLWLIIIVTLPIIGLAIYTLFCLIKADWNFITPIFQSRKMDKQISSPKKVNHPTAKA
jgi:hypothetical protein